MIERGHGRTSGLTDWHLMNVLNMWACLQDQETTGQWKQVAGWRKVCDLARAHLTRLQEYRRGLAEAWPPQTNAAARAYLAELDQLIDKAQHTHDAAAANHDALAAATRAIASTRTDLKPIHDEYAAKLQQKRAYEATLADPKAVAGSRLPERPPVTDADLEQLNVRARSLMTGLSAELQQAQVMLRQPPPRPNIRRQPDQQEHSVDSISAPVIPPIVPAPTAIAASSTRQHAAPNRPDPIPTSPISGHVSSGLILGGVGSALAPAPPNTGPAPLTPPLTPSQPTSPGVQVPPPHSYGPMVPIRGDKANPMRGQANPMEKPVSGGVNETPPSSPRPLPPGGLIGGTPAAGLGQPTNRGNLARRVNPIGGVIGGGGAGTAPSGAAGSRPGSGRASQLGGHGGLPPIGGAPGSGFSAGTSGGGTSVDRNPYSDHRTRSWDPDQPWEVDTGVAPVMRPPDSDGPPDPGPAIGLDR